MVRGCLLLSFVLWTLAALRVPYLALGVKNLSCAARMNLERRPNQPGVPARIVCSEETDGN